MSGLQPSATRLPVGPGMRACGNCGAGTPLGSPEGMCQACRDERDAIRQEAWARLAAAKQGTAPAAPAEVAAPAAVAEEEELQEYVDDLPPAPAPAPRPMRPAPQPHQVFPGQGPSPLRPLAPSGQGRARRRGTAPLKVGEHRFAPERVAYAGPEAAGPRRKAAAGQAKAAPKAAPVVVVRAKAPGGGSPWAAMAAGVLVALGLGGWVMMGGSPKVAEAPKVAFTPKHVAQAAAPRRPSVEAQLAAQAMALAAPASLPDRDEASRVGAAVLSSAPVARFVAPAPRAYAPPASRPVAFAPAPQAYRYAAPAPSRSLYRHVAPRAAAPLRYRLSSAPRVRGQAHSLSEALVMTSRPGAAPGSPRRQGGVEVIGW